MATKIMDETSEAPKWLDVLENRRKRPHKLAHDIGAGSPCLICKEKCKGLNLHFWRKICIECKCRKEDHNFLDEEEYVQFEILFGAKRVKKTTLKYNADSKIFDWVPQNTSKELIVDYLNAIPESKLPITDSEGARYRRQQLEKQLPIHDVNPKACHSLTEKEIIEFGKYLNNLRKNVIGQGRVMKFKNCDFYGSCSSTDVMPMKSEAIKPKVACIRGRLIRDAKPEVKTIFSEKVCSQESATASASKMDIINRNNVPEGLLLYSTNQFSSDSKITFKDPAQIQVEAVTNHSNVALPCGGSGLVKDAHCNCYSENNNMSNKMCNEHGREILSIDQLRLNNVKNQMADEEPKLFVEEYFSLPVNVMNVSSCELPFTPIQESQYVSLEKGAIEVKPVMSQSADLTKLERGQKCAQCLSTFGSNETVVNAERGGKLALWHARCFVCEICKELLVDLMYFYHEGKVYCGRDYAKARNIPRCFACDELIFVKEYTQAEGQAYHVKHFCCYHCDTPLGGKQYIPKNEQPVCLNCYQNQYGKNCSTCANTIPVAEQRISLGELHFHIDPKCFRCEKCLKYLAGEKLVLKNRKPFCSKECFQMYKFHVVH